MSEHERDVSDIYRKVELNLPPGFPQELLIVIRDLVRFGKGEVREYVAEADSNPMTKPASEFSVPREIGHLAVPDSPLIRIYRASDIIEQSAAIEPGTNTDQLEAQAELSTKSLEVAAKFARAFDEDMPEYRGVFKTMRKLGKDPRRKMDHLCTYYVKDVEGKQVQFSYFLMTDRNYHEKKLKLEKAYTLHAVHIKIGNPEEAPYVSGENYAGSFDPILRLGFSGGDITEIRISWDEQSDHAAFDAVINGTVLEAFFTKVSPLIDHKALARQKGYKVKINRHNISFDLSEASLTVNRTFKVDGGGDMDSFGIYHAYELDETGNQLIRRARDRRHNDEDLQTDFNITFPQSIPPADYIRVIESLFGIIPAH